MEQTIPLDIQDVLTINEIITLLTQQRKLIDQAIQLITGRLLLNFCKYMVSARRA